MARSYQSNRSGSAILDGTPPSPPEKILSKPTEPGEDTASLLGDQNLGDTFGGVFNESGSKLMMAVSLFMSAANLMDSVAPGRIPEPIRQWIASEMETAPLLAEQMSNQSDPSALLAAVGGSAAGSPTPPMGAPAMGMPGGMMSGRPPMGGSGMGMGRGQY